MTVLYAGDEAERHVAAYGNILQLVVESETTLTLGTCVDEMIAHTCPTKSYGEAGKNKLRGTELSCRIFGSIRHSYNRGGIFDVDRNSILRFERCNVCIIVNLKVRRKRIDRKGVGMRHTRTT